MAFTAVNNARPRRVFRFRDAQIVVSKHSYISRIKTAAPALLLAASLAVAAKA